MFSNKLHVHHPSVACYFLQGVKPSNAFPAPKPHAAADAICGAPAQALAAAEEQKRADHKDAAGEQLESASDWEVRQHRVQLRESTERDLVKSIKDAM